jgi:hypothetical protein
VRFFGTVLTLAAALGAGCTFDPTGTAIGGGEGDDDTIDAGPFADAPVHLPGDGAPDPTPDAMPPTTPDAAPEPPACPDGYTFDPTTGSAYRVGSVLVGWYGGEDACEGDGDGTHLVIVDDAHEADVIAALATPFRAWTGVTDTVAEDTFVTVTGVFAGFTPWKQGEPNDAGLFGEDCTTLDEGGLNDEACIGPLHAYVCECDGVPVDPQAYE